jgi:hypothetical protein
MTRQGLPAATTSGGIGFVTTLPASMVVRAPITTPGSTMTPAPSHASSSMRMGAPRGHRAHLALFVGQPAIGCVELTPAGDELNVRRQKHAIADGDVLAILDGDVGDDMGGFVDRAEALGEERAAGREIHADGLVVAAGERGPAPRFGDNGRVTRS